MEKYTFYIQPDTDNEEQMKNVAGLLEALHQNYGVTYEAVVRVETDKEFLVPMLRDLEGQSQGKVDVATFVPQLWNEVKSAVIEADLGNVCPECGNLFNKGGIKGFCSKKCYNIDYRKTHKAEKKPNKKGYKTSVEIQDAAARNRTTEEERVDAVVAAAKLDVPGAMHEHHSTGPIMARKL